MSVGRPRNELTTKRKRELERLYARRESAYAKLVESRTKLANAARDALDEGASVRAIGEALGLPRTSVLRFIQENATKL